jgi:hypothetical protein
MAENAAKGKRTRLEQRYRERAEAKMQQAEVLRKLIIESKEPLQLEQEAS